MSKPGVARLVFLYERENGNTYKSLHDIVFFDKDMSNAAVCHSLINHDGYPSNIFVTQERKRW